MTAVQESNTFKISRAKYNIVERRRSRRKQSADAVVQPPSSVSVIVDLAEECEHEQCR